MEKLIKGTFLIIFSLCGSILGWNVHKYTLPIFQELPAELLPVNGVIFTSLGIIIGITLSQFTSKSILNIVDSSAKKLLSMPSGQLAGSAAGLIIGLIISSLIIFILSVIPLELIPFGKYIFALTALVISIFLCYMGIFFGAKIIGKIPISSKILNSPKGLDILCGNKYKIIDTSVIIDGRIQEIAKSGFLEGTMTVPRFVLAELQALADSSDDMKRTKGRKGLELLEAMRKEFSMEIIEQNYPELPVDDKLIKLALEMQAVLVTIDYNLNKVATVQGVNVLNINDLSNALKPAIVPGEILKATVLKEGKEQNQGVAYMENGTMIVIENGKKYIGEEVVIEATSCLQTSAGKMVFAKIYQGKYKQ